jgi:murein DD-endopeptidase MepM/ murein hydrolase activator NlpD
MRSDFSCLRLLAEPMCMQYVHHQHRGVRVQQNEQASAGQPIGLSGATGSSLWPHLHFCVSRPLVDGTPQSFTVRLQVAEIHSPVALREGQRYTAATPQ